MKQEYLIGLCVAIAIIFIFMMHVRSMTQTKKGYMELEQPGTQNIIANSENNVEWPKIIINTFDNILSISGPNNSIFKNISDKMIYIHVDALIPISISGNTNYSVAAYLSHTSGNVTYNYGSTAAPSFAQTQHISYTIPLAPNDSFSVKFICNINNAIGKSGIIQSVTNSAYNQIMSIAQL